LSRYLRQLFPVATISTETARRTRGDEPPKVRGQCCDVGKLELRGALGLGSGLALVSETSANVMQLRYVSR
jgi:hypothetical protein